MQQPQIRQTLPSKTPLVIAIDGPSGSGKGTIAGYLAAQFNLAHIDSGLIYRQVGLYVMDHHLDPDDLSAKDEEVIKDFITTIDPKTLDADARLRLEKTANVASKLAALDWIRKAVNQWLYAQVDNPPEGVVGYVIDGRDITTAVFPNACAKFYITADEHVRLERRKKETLEVSSHITRNMNERDRRDATRKIDPLTVAVDAFIIDTTHLSIDEACHNASQCVTERCF